VETFLKHSSIIQYSNPALTKVVDAIDALAQSEGFSSRGDTVKRRLQSDR
jgi:histidinol dehydrogenase